MLEKFFNRYNNIRKEKYFQNPLFKVQKKYACIGIGMHSLSNIYPVLRHFNIPVKYICTNKSNRSREMASLFSESIFTNDISAVLNDPEIAAAIVCASPDAHYSLVSPLLKAGKKVFVEKPPCSSLAELNDLIAINKYSVCKVGLQRRYWPGNKYLLSRTKKTSSYIYQFYFGPYLQGNVLTGLFIHAIDYCIFLFGDFNIISCTFQKDNAGVTVQLHVRHSGGVAGMIELSTHYSWNDPIENLMIQCADELLTVKYPMEVSGVQKPKRVLHIPIERFSGKPIIRKNYFSAGNLVMPVFESNTLVLQGFYKELETFIRVVESGNNLSNENDLTGLQPVYKILDELNKLIYRTASS